MAIRAYLLPMTKSKSKPLVLVTGATGYIGGRLYPRLMEADFPVRCMIRDPVRFRGRDAGVEWVEGDVLIPETLPAALTGVHTAFYLIHSMGSPERFAEADARAARNFGGVAREAGVKHIVYLGGLGDDTRELSDHLSSRQEVGRILRESGVPVTEFRASIIIGSGSLSFEMIRALVERLPFMITPRWVGTLAQPIAIDDVLSYLLQSAEREPAASRMYEIGGTDQVSYHDLMMAYAGARGLKRRMIAVPVLSPRLSSLWLGLVTPLYARVGRKLVDSLKYPTVCRDDSALQDFHVRPLGYREAIGQALRNEDRAYVETRWSDSLSAIGAPKTWAGIRLGNRLLDVRQIHIPLPPEQVFIPVVRIGGINGWYYADFLWRIRGLLDLLAGGPGLRRGRRDPENLQAGDTLDCWRVEDIDAPRRLLLRAEMKLPGRAWLEFKIDAEGDGSRLTQTAMFDPRGLSGLLYWYAVYPLHEIVFAGLIKAIARRAFANH